MTKSQEATLEKIKPLFDASEDGEITEDAARAAGAHLASLRALVSAGILSRRHGSLIAPEGHAYAGELLNNQAFYRAN